jgi:hypothetical protein
MINIQTARKRKRDILTREEHKALLRYVKTFPTIIDAACTIGIHRNVLDLVMIKGSGSPETISKIKAVLQAA